MKWFQNSPRMREQSAAAFASLPHLNLEFSSVSARYTTDGQLSTPSSSSPSLALNGVSFIAPAAHVTCVVGRSGSGKSSLLNVVLGLLEVSAAACVHVLPRVALFESEGVLGFGRMCIFRISAHRHLHRTAAEVIRCARAPRVCAFSRESAGQHRSGASLLGLGCGGRGLRFAHSIARDQTER
jgi:energy-coupling factor transporter ATP-binding protein EcfA2